MISKELKEDLKKEYDIKGIVEDKLYNIKMSELFTYVLDLIRFNKIVEKKRFTHDEINKLYLEYEDIYYMLLEGIEFFSDEEIKENYLKNFMNITIKEALDYLIKYYYKEYDNREAIIGKIIARKELNRFLSNITYLIILKNNFEEEKRKTGIYSQSIKVNSMDNNFKEIEKKIIEILEL